MLLHLQLTILHNIFASVISSPILNLQIEITLMILAFLLTLRARYSFHIFVVSASF